MSRHISNNYLFFYSIGMLNTFFLPIMFEFFGKKKILFLRLKVGQNKLKNEIVSLPFILKQCRFRNTMSPPIFNKNKEITSFCKQC